MSWATHFMLLCATCALTSGLVVADDEPPNLPPPHLTQIVFGKMDLLDGKPRLILMLDSYRVERLRIEETRRVVRIDEAEGQGGDATETVVEEPTTTNHEIVRMKSAGMKPKVVDLNDVKFFDIHWTAISIEQAAEQLKAAGPIFLLDAGVRAGPFSSAQLRALNPKTLILVTPNRIRQIPREADPFGGDPFGG
ncbi:hypothetical protein [Stieleria varia]|uniref:Uncharacterized protein n=1 Tax=Stieleria varia TaxID=2528005 RepID=A0A5C6ANR1_9BACT|nr:hypothetical protein [Stieleria varia]TWU01147.1 hypothetical protein Pla52n_45190 [Stieleria varia]